MKVGRQVALAAVARTVHGFGRPTIAPIVRCHAASAGAATGATANTFSRSCRMAQRSSCPADTTPTTPGLSISVICNSSPTCRKAILPTTIV